MFRRLLIGITVAIALTVGGVAWATIPSSGGTINACYMKGTGIVRIINAPSEKCLKIETPISWSQAGPQGEPGAQGAQGPAGSAKAYGTVSAPGGIGWRTNHNIVGVWHPETGIYCVEFDSSVDMTTSVAAVTVESGSAEPRFATAAVHGCLNTENNVQVNVFDAATDQLVDSTFYVTVP